MKFARLLLVLAAAVIAHAQSWDNSGNSKLSGEFYFRQVYYIIGDQYGDLGEGAAAYGNINFHGDGTYTITTTERAQVSDYSYYYGAYVGGCATASTTGVCPLIVNGTYSISASGYGWISSPYASGDNIYGLVSAQGIFVGSSTENTNGYNDMMIAAPVASPLPTASSFTGSWTCADFDFSSGSPSTALGLMFTMSPNGVNSLGSVNVTGYYGASTTALAPQTYNGLAYSFSNGAAIALFPSIQNDYITSQKYLYFSKDGNFVFGGSPNSFDFIVGVKSSSAAPTVGGLYYQSGVDNVGGNLDSYLGSFNVIAGAAPQTVLGHQRLNFFGGSFYEDYTYDNTVSLSGSTYTDSTAKYVAGDGGAVIITSGIAPYLGLSVAVQAPTPTGSGVYLNPSGVVNSASNAPFTAGIAPGELLTMYGSGLAASTAIAGIPFPATLNNVSVTIGGLPAPIYYVSANQISAIVPYGILPLASTNTCGCVQIQVTNNNTQSNIVTEFVSATAPGVFTQNQNGTGYGEIEHTGYGNSGAAPGSVVTDKNPALPGETLSVYLTGLGAVTPAIADGAAGPASLSNAVLPTVYFSTSSTAVTPSFAGLAPGYSGLYQMNITVPSDVTAGPNFLDIAGSDAEMNYLLVPIATATTSIVVTPNARTAPATVLMPRYQKRTQTTKTPRKITGNGGN